MLTKLLFIVIKNIYSNNGFVILVINTRNEPSEEKIVNFNFEQVLILIQKYAINIISESMRADVF